eukprot:TRINITY_DN69696_c0_g1_i1.p1 TRINITY_DN69696_c0_g1~~TRINITY_DN69696_c0_g1_i1.p1  ORF type:complete len:321 (-),score=44.62 TRINITY_DN69696_c0_g1_i1:79-996(-)
MVGFSSTFGVLDGTLEESAGRRQATKQQQPMIVDVAVPSAFGRPTSWVAEPAYVRIDPLKIQTQNPVEGLCTRDAECSGGNSGCSASDTKKLRSISSASTCDAKDISNSFTREIEPIRMSRDVSARASMCQASLAAAGAPSPVRGKAARKAQSQNRGDHRWWSNAHVVQVCPLTQFPIRLLPYPPFKLREKGGSRKSHSFVDGKFLALQVIINGGCFECGRSLDESDLEALDDYISRCKMGCIRPKRSIKLATQIASTTDSSEKKKLTQALRRMVASARSNLTKLRHIQANRLAQLSEPLVPEQP